jgi:hypothetical protein
MAVYSLVHALVTWKGFKIAFSPEIARSIIALNHSLASNVQTFRLKTKEVYTLLSKHFEGYSSDTLIQKVLAGVKSPIKFTFLSYIALEEKDGKLIAEIAGKFSNLVMNDKEKSNFLNIPFFLPFIQGINEAQFVDLLYPEIDFMMKRGLSMVALIT